MTREGRGAFELFRPNAGQDKAHEYEGLENFVTLSN